MRGALLGLVVDPDPAHERYEGRLSIPFITPTGVVHMRFRCLEKHDPDETCDDLFHGKYEGLAGEETRLFNVRALHLPSPVIGICEGELDALVATAAGLPSVGVPGVHNWRDYYYRLLDDYEHVVLLGDGDRAGREFIANLAANIPYVVRRPLPEGHDVSSYVVDHGPEAFMKFVGVTDA